MFNLEVKVLTICCFSSLLFQECCWVKKIRELQGDVGCGGGGKWGHSGIPLHQSSELLSYAAFFSSSWILKVQIYPLHIYSPQISDILQSSNIITMKLVSELFIEPRQFTVARFKDMFPFSIFFSAKTWDFCLYQFNLICIIKHYSFWRRQKIADGTGKMDK